MSTLRWRFLLMVVATTALPDTSSSGDHSRHTRQIDTSGLTDAEFLCRLTAADNGRNPNDCIEDTEPGPDSAAVTAGCKCAPVWQCKDDRGPSKLEIDTGSFLTQVNVRTASGCPKPEEVCCFNIDIMLKPKTPPFSPSCGTRNTKGVVTNFVGFKNLQSQFGEYPWMVAVMTSEKFGDVQAPLYICGGSLIHSQVVLTAAHYVHGKRTAKELAVRLGEWNFKEKSESVLHQDLLVNEVLVHPNYVPSILAFDIALLILERPAQLGHTVDTICLPPPFYDFKDHLCVVSGWGKDVFSELGKYQQILKSIELPTVNHASCERAMQRTRLGTSFHLHESFMCAGGEEGRDACEGDGGSPLACHKPGDPSKYYQAGVVSWGIGCGQAGVPGVYADVSKAIPWIQQILAERFSYDIRIGAK